MKTKISSWNLFLRILMYGSGPFFIAIAIGMLITDGFSIIPLLMLFFFPILTCFGYYCLNVEGAYFDIEKKVIIFRCVPKIQSVTVPVSLIKEINIVRDIRQIGKAYKIIFIYDAGGKKEVRFNQFHLPYSKKTSGILESWNKYIKEHKAEDVVNNTK